MHIHISFAKCILQLRASMDSLLLRKNLGRASKKKHQKNHSEQSLLMQSSSRWSETAYGITIFFEVQKDANQK